ncbi:HAD family hydrolase [Litoreibacter albidus]|uniref:Haloacid dehalogenase superfamily, subfamily IA, variant 3 with third motif having DD or ED n=1 Tax=Litoreibacter albidus TaxID=670155 RepID=A0A1H3CMZ2_9RHOB|nr:HAD family phosphatase [Litoreibacter albidus]SDX54954.1 haloacid dehalogenase superfamily, subfamily IA, variant 3 with third motif having DD or ED [Litoreibacter albidus]
MTRAVLWDMDGTLTDSEPAHAAAFDAALTELGVTVPAELHDGLLGSSGDKVFRALQAATDIALTQDGWTALKQRHFAHHAQAIVRREPAASSAERLTADGIPTALVSNSTAAEVAVCLEATGLVTTFSAVVTRGNVAQGKPAPECYLLAAHRLGIAPHDCIVVEDSPTGAKAGVAAGMTVVFHPQSHALQPPDGVHYIPPEATSDAFIEAFLKTKDNT